jgi:hypothetical protein
VEGTKTLNQLGRKPELQLLVNVVKFVANTLVYSCGKEVTGK